MTATPRKSRLLLYGAYGYTGRLTAELAAARQLEVILAGRNREALSELGARLNLPTRAVGLDDPAQLAQALADVACVVHMAGPFVETAAPMLAACLATRTHYLDITGEIPVFEMMWARADDIRRAGITAMPGAGFDVVPTDCLAAYVAGTLEQPTTLVIAIGALQRVTQGTLRTALRQMSNVVLCRRNGIVVSLDDRSPRAIDFGSGAEPCLPISWGDVETAFHSTGAGDITVYVRPTTLFRSASAVQRTLGTWLRGPVAQRSLAALVRMLPEGPSEDERRQHRSVIWAEAVDRSGRSARAWLSTPDAYDFTANSALAIATRVAALPQPLGLVTPSQAFGADFVLGLPGCARTDA